jgi:hypothetical protein
MEAGRLRQQEIPRRQGKVLIQRKKKKGQRSFSIKKSEKVRCAFFFLWLIAHRLSASGSPLAVG